MTPARFAPFALLLTLAGCDVRERLGAAEGVRDFLAAANKPDQAAFEARIDRSKVRKSLVEALRAQPGLDPRVLERVNTPEGARMVDGMVTPEAFRLSFSRMGLKTGATPSAPEIGAALRMQGPDRACVPEGPTSDRCVLTFERQGELWKLVAVAPSQMKVEVRPAG